MATIHKGLPHPMPPPRPRPQSTSDKLIADLSINDFLNELTRIDAVSNSETLIAEIEKRADVFAKDNVRFALSFADYRLHIKAAMLIGASVAIELKDLR